MCTIDDLFNLLDELRRTADKVWAGELGEFDLNAWASVSAASLDVMHDATLLVFGRDPTDEQIVQTCNRIRNAQESLLQVVVQAG